MSELFDAVAKDCGEKARLGRFATCGELPIVIDLFFPRPASAGRSTNSPNPMMQEAEALDKELRALESKNTAEVTAQGGLGQFVDGLKEKVGGSAEGLPAIHPGAVWSNVLNHDDSSASVDAALHSSEEKIAALKLAAQSGNQDEFNNLYKSLTERDFDGRVGQTPLAVQRRTDRYAESQANMVDLAADGASLAVTLGTSKFLRSGNMVQNLALGSGIGGLTKVEVKQADGRYANPLADMATGSLSGLSVPGGEAVSRLVLSKIGAETSMRRYVAAGVMDNSIQGGGFGFFDAGTREAASQNRQGQEFDPGKILEAANQGLVLGIAGGGILGLGSHSALGPLRTFDPAITQQATTSIQTAGFRYLTPDPPKVDIRFLGKAKPVDVAELPPAARVNPPSDALTSTPGDKLKQLPGEEFAKLLKSGDIPTLARLIFAKFESSSLTMDQLGKVLSSFSAEDQKMVQALLEHSSPNASSTGLRNQMQGLNKTLQALENDGKKADFFTISGASSGNYLSYFLRKTLKTLRSESGKDFEIHSLDNLKDLIAQGKTPQHIVLVDDFKSANLSKEQLELLKQVPDVTIVSLPSFEHGINFFDMSAGPDAVSKKLSNLLSEAKQLSAKDPDASVEEIAKSVLSNGARDLKKELPQARLIRPDSSVVQSSGSLEELHSNLVPRKTTVEKIEEFLSDKKFTDEQRSLLGRFLAEGVEYKGFGGIEARSKALFEKLSAQAVEYGYKPEDLLFVSDVDPGGSTHMVSYAIKHATGIPDKQFVTVAELKRLIASGEAKDKAVVILDDTIYSGAAVGSWLDGGNSKAGFPGHFFENFGHTFTASYGIFEKGQARLARTAIAKDGKLTPVFLEKLPSLEETSFYRGLSEQEKNTFNELLPKFSNALFDPMGFGDTGAPIVWSHMVPDNSPAMLNVFAQEVLGLPGT